MTDEAVYRRAHAAAVDAILDTINDPAQLTEIMAAVEDQLVEASVELMRNGTVTIPLYGAGQVTVTMNPYDVDA